MTELWIVLLAIGPTGAVLARSARSRRAAAHSRSLARPLHELRGAMTALELGLTALERFMRRFEPQPGSSELLRRADSLRAQLERLAVAADDLEARRQGKPPSPRGEPRDVVELGAIVRRSVLAWIGIAPDFGARLELHWSAGEAWVAGKTGRLRQVIDNLIANALQHGGGRVVVKGEPGHGGIRITVTDGGPGLPTDALTLPEASSRSVHGHGLAIVRDIVECYGGRVTAPVLGNQGVVFELPTVSAASRPVTPAVDAPATNGGTHEFPAASLAGSHRAA